MTFGENLISLREARNVSRRELAEKLDIPYTTLRNYETNQREPGHKLLIQLAQMFSVTVDSLIGAPTSAKKEASSDLPEEALKVARDYHDLDQPGKNVVRVVIAEEGKRVQAEKLRRQVEPAIPSETRLIPLYYTPAAAGLMEPAEGQDFDYIEVDKDVPREADFAVRISGDSMEPYIRDGSTVFVNRQPLVNGDVGIFCVDEDIICKQYYKDEWGNVRLLSLNRYRSDADRFIDHRDNDTIMRYYGRVILGSRPKISLL